MIVALLGLVVGVAVLATAADHFVAGAVQIANRLRLSVLIIGAVVVGFGTSAPEMVVSALAAGQGNLDLAVGNIVGSNIANLSLVLGASTLVATIGVASPTIRREAPLAFGATVVFALLVQGGISRPEAVLLVVLLGVVLAIVVRSSRTEDLQFAGEVEDYLAEGEKGVGRAVAQTALGLIGTLAAAQLLVASARTLAETVGLAEGFVGLTIVAVGTSLPELATALQAARHGETDLIVGNLLGSNVFNSLGVAGIAGLVGPGPVGDPSLTGLAVVLMLVVTTLAAVAMVTGRRVVRAEGVLLLVVWAAMIPLVA